MLMCRGNGEALHSSWQTLSSPLSKRLHSFSLSEETGSVMAGLEAMACF